MDQFFVLNKDALKRPTEWKVVRLECCGLEKKMLISHQMTFSNFISKSDILIVLKRKTWLNFSMEM